ncbi:glycosyltransferase family 1 protein [Campylobacter sp. RM16188]|uniref:glycosyltransferase family 4 protein n=1 Tax=Campylobacter sp. RM16188 TaxID=1705725 RepID=UPI001553C74B|nr:glycosyltransferase family 1 protein [Campylobacter sp. RM16188]
MKAKILVDTKSLLSSLSGVGRYAYEVLRGLDKDKFDAYFNYGFISQEIILPKKQDALSVKDLYRKKITRALKAIFIFFPTWFKTAARVVLKKLNEYRLKECEFDIYFQPNFIPLDVNAKFIVVAIHDLAFIKHKEFHPKDRIEFFDKFFVKNISKADKIITVSNFIKKEIVATLEIDSKDVEVIYNGYDENVFYKRDKIAQTSLKDELDLKKEFILFVGSIEPRKNLKTLIKSYNLLDEDLQNKFDLVIVGAKGWENSEIHNLIKQNSNIKFLGYIDDESLATLYSAATVFVYPSVYEGFGIPPLEAMACGCPVMLSDIEVFREIYSSNAVFFDTLNEVDLKEKMLNLLTDKDKQIKLAECGLEFCKNFTWAKSAKAHSDLFLSLKNSI